jgi:hypothetical protein
MMSSERNEKRNDATFNTIQNRSRMPFAVLAPVSGLELHQETPRLHFVNVTTDYSTGARPARPG